MSAPQYLQLSPTHPESKELTADTICMASIYLSPVEMRARPETYAGFTPGKYWLHIQFSFDILFPLPARENVKTFPCKMDKFIMLLIPVICFLGGKFYS